MCNLIQRELKKDGKIIQKSSSISRFGKDEISNCILAGTLTALDKISKKDKKKYYVLGVKYDLTIETKIKKKILRWQDSQMGITGHPYYDENEIDGLSREMGEELGLEFDGKNIDDYLLFKDSNISSDGSIYTNKFYGIPLSKTKVKSQHPIEKNNGDNKYLRYIIFVYGTLEEIIDYMSHKEIDLINSDNIVSILGIRLDFVENIYNTITNYGREKYPYRGRKFYLN